MDTSTVTIENSPTIDCKLLRPNSARRLFTGRSSEGKDRSNVYKSTKIKRFQIEMNHNEMPILGEGGANEGDERGGLAREGGISGVVGGKQ